MRLALALAILIGVVVPFAAYLLWWLDRFGGERLWRFVAVFVVAGGCALGLGALDLPEAVVGVAAALAHSAPAWLTAPLMGFLRGAAAGLVVVAAQGLVLLLVAGWRRMEMPMDGIVFGIAAGSGFALARNLAALLAGRDGDWESVLWRGALLVAATATLGAGLPGARVAPRWPRRLARLTGVWLAGALVYAALSLVQDLSRAVWMGVVAGLLLLVGLLAFTLTVERRVLREYLADEVALGVLPAWVVDIVPSYLRRIRSGWWPRRDERREIARLLVGLASRKHRLRGLPAQQLLVYGLEVGRLRQRARTLLALAPAANEKMRAET